MNERLLIGTLCGLGLLSTVGASLPYPMLAPLFADGNVNASTVSSACRPSCCWAWR